MRANPCAQGCTRSQDCIWPVYHLLLRMNDRLFQGHQICNSIPAAPRGSLHKACLFRLCVGWGMCYPTAQKWWLLQNRDLFFIVMCCLPGAVEVSDTDTHKKSEHYLREALLPQTPIPGKYPAQNKWQILKNSCQSAEADLLQAGKTTHNDILENHQVNWAAEESSKLQ